MKDHHPFLKRVMIGMLALAVLTPFIPGSLSSSSTVNATPVIPADSSGVVMVENFENVNLNELYLDSKRNKGVTLSLETNPKYVRNGAKSLRFDYDFIGVTDNPSQFAVGDITQKVALTGRVPKKVGMWVYGNNEGHGVTVTFKNAANSTRTYNIRDEETGIDWMGWKYVEAEIGSDMSVPGYMAFYFQVKQRQMSKKNKGSLWIDDVRLIYDEPVGEDMTVPVVTPTSPTPNQTLNAPLSDMTLSADDVGTGIDPNSIQLSVNGQSVTSATYAYDPVNKLITYHPDAPLDGGYYEVNAAIKDISGNPATADYSFNIEHGARFTMEAPEELLNSEIYRLQLGAKDVGTAKSVHAKLKFDPATLQAQAITGRSDLSNVQTTIDNVGGYVEFSADGLQGDNVNPLASIDFEFTKTANMERGETFKQIRMTEGGFGYTGGISVNSIAAPINYKIAFPYNLAIRGAGLQTQSTITVTNHDGAPVAGAAIEYIDADGPQTYVTVIAGSSTIYKNADGTTPLLAVQKDQQFFATTGSTSGFVTVYMPDGSRKAYISSADVQQNDLKLGIGFTDSKGEIHSPLLTLAKGTWALQAVKDDGTTKSMSMVIVDQFGNDDPQYVQTFVAEDMRTMMNVGWQTAPRVQQTSIQYKKESEPTKSIAKDALSEVQVIQNAKTGPLGEIKFHQASVTGLEPGTKYLYRVGYEGHWSTWYDYMTADPAQDKPTSFVFVTDSHTKGDNGLETYQQLLTDALKRYPNTQFIMHGGDMVDDGQFLEEWTQFWKASSIYAPSIPSGYTMGNHDVKSEGYEVFAKGLELPKNGPDFMKEYAYSFDTGEVHFTVLNTEADDVNTAKQAEWLREDIQKSNKKWKIVMFHKPTYHTEEGRGDQSELSQTYFAPVLEELGVDLVLVGHDHVYAHTYPMKQGKPLNNGERGTVYLDGGAAGWKFYDGTKYDYLDFIYDVDVPLYTAIQVSHDKISIQARTTESEDLIDDYSIEKLDAAVTSVSVSPTTASVVQGSTQQLTATVTAVGGANPTVTWTSSNSKVAVAANGLVTVVGDAAPGNYTVTATSTFDSSKKGTATITVTASPTGTAPTGTPSTGTPTTGTPTTGTPATGTPPPISFFNEKVNIEVIKALVEKANSAPKVSFKDVPKDSPIAKTIELAAKLGIVKGQADGSFHANAVVTRAEFATMLVRALGLESSGSATFKDAKGHWAESSINALQSSGISSGYADGSFKPNQSISRAEIVYMLSKVMNTTSASNPTKFNDIAGSWAKDAITRLSDNGIINGAGDGSFNPNAKATRSESLLMILRVLNVSLGHSLDID